MWGDKWEAPAIIKMRHDGILDQEDRDDKWSDSYIY